MAVGFVSLPLMHPVNGVRLGTAKAGIRISDRRDLLVMEFAEGASVATVFTRNAFCAAPVIVAREHLQQAKPRGLIVNSGNANAGTGEAGLEAARVCCQAAAELLGCEPEQVLPFSTGVIGRPLPVERIQAGLPGAVAELASAGWEEAARAIMTTDTEPKGVSRVITIDGKSVVISGIAKGSGMIRPHMATMLAFIAIDAEVPWNYLQVCLNRVVERSFNRISVDGDTSTNDACVLVATGKGEVRIDKAQSPEFKAIVQAIQDVCIDLAQAIVRDGEGATKFITVQVMGGKTEQECDVVAFTVAESPLVKTAFFGKDPNWGRILAAVGRAGVAELDVGRIDIFLDDLRIVHRGSRDEEYTEESGRRVMDKDEITVRIELNRGEARNRVWTCDLSYEYVKINAEYTT